MQQFHVKRLPSSKFFSSTDLKQLLPFHQDTAIANLRIIFNNYALSNYPKKIILLPDQNLFFNKPLTSLCYTNVKAIWQQDFDNKPELLKNSLYMASLFLNYIASIDQQSPFAQKQQASQDYIQQLQVFSIQNGQKVEQKKHKYHQIPQQKTTIGFKFQKHDNKIYMIIGIGIKSRQAMALSCAILRQWNLNRLKINQFQGIDLDLIHRFCQHLYCMGRGFTRKVSDDYNTFHANVSHFLKKISQYNIQNNKKICDAFKQYNLNSGNSLSQDITIIKSQIKLKNNISQQSIWQIVSQCVVEWLLQSPINVSCSFSSYSHYNEKNNSIILLFGVHYTVSNKNKQTQLEDLKQSICKIQVLLYDQMYQKPQRQIHPLKPSLNVRTKYQKTPQRIQNQYSKQQRTPQSMNSSFVSQISMSNSNSNSTQRQKSTKSNVGKLQSQLYQILKMLQIRKGILSPTQIQQIIRKYISWLRRSENKPGVNSEQYDALETLHGINYNLTAQEVYSIIKNNINQMVLIIPMLIQRNTYQRAIAVGKMIADDFLPNLYKDCLKNGLIGSQHTIIPVYLKKLINVFVQPAIEPKSLKIEQISVPQLVQIIQKKNYQQHFYTSIIRVILPQLFQHFQPVIKVISPLLLHFSKVLVGLGHHQELVFSFIGQLLYQVCYFISEIKLSSLTNAVYFQDKYSKMLTIKERKILQMIRQGGLKGFGFQIKTLILPTIEKHKNNTQSQYIIYHIIRIEKPMDLFQFYKILNSCHYTPNLSKIAKYLEYKGYFQGVLQQKKVLVCCILVKDRDQQYQFNIKIDQQDTQKQNQQVQQTQFHSIAERILRSQSGIFQDIVKLNPNVKIAGIELKTAMKSMIDSRKENLVKFQSKKGTIDQQQAVRTYITKQMKQSYQFCQLALSIKQKYINYHTLGEIQKSYFKQCAKNVIKHRENIEEYVYFNDNVKGLDRQIG